MATLKPQPVSEETRQAVAQCVRATLTPLFDDITAVEFGHSADIYIVRLENTRPVTDTSWPRAILTRTALTVVTNGTRSVTVKVPSEWLVETSVAAEPDTAEAARRARILQTLRDLDLDPISIDADPDEDRGDYVVCFKSISVPQIMSIDSRSPFGTLDSGTNWVSIMVPRDWPPREQPVIMEVVAPQDERATRILDALRAVRLEPVSARCIDETGGIWRVEFVAVSLPIINIISGDKTPFQVSSSGGTWVNIRVFDDFWAADVAPAAKPAVQEKREFAVGDTVITRTGHRGQIEVIVGGLARVKTANDCRNHALDTLKPAAPDPVITDNEPKPETEPLPELGDTEQMPGIVIGDPADLPEFLITGAPEAGEPFAAEELVHLAHTDGAAVPLSVYGEGQGEGFEDEPTDGLSLEEIFEQAGVVAQEDHEAEIERLRVRLAAAESERDAYKTLLDLEFRPTCKQFCIERDTHPARMEQLDREGWTLAHMQFDGDKLHTVWQREVPAPTGSDETDARAEASAPRPETVTVATGQQITIDMQPPVGALNKHARPARPQIGDLNGIITQWDTAALQTAAARTRQIFEHAAPRPFTLIPAKV